MDDKPDVVAEFSNAELVTALLKLRGIHEGLWCLSVKFSLGVGNLRQEGQDSPDPVPSAFIGVQGVGLQRATNNVAGVVDASAANPATKGRKVALKKQVSKAA